MTYRFFAVALLLLSGCMPRLDAFKLALDGTTKVYEATNSAWTKEKAAERDACLAPPVPPAASPACVEEVIARWAPRSAALKSFFAALNMAGMVLSIVETQDILKRPIDLGPLEKAIGDVLIAAQAVQQVLP